VKNNERKREREKEKMMFYVCWWRERREGKKKEREILKICLFLKFNKNFFLFVFYLNIYKQN